MDGPNRILLMIALAQNPIRFAGRKKPHRNIRFLNNRAMNVDKIVIV